MFESLSERLAGVFDKLRGRGALNELEVRAAMREVRIALLEAALVRIRDIDYRGNRNESSVIAFDVLQEKDNE
jgi:signal recognition particle GTPase